MKSRIEELSAGFIDSATKLEDAVHHYGAEIDSAGVCIADGIINGVKYQVQIIMQSDPEYFMPPGDIVLSHPDEIAPRTKKLLN